MLVVWLHKPEMLMGWFFGLLGGSLYRALQGHLDMSELSEEADLNARETELLCLCC